MAGTARSRPTGTRPLGHRIGDAAASLLSSRSLGRDGWDADNLALLAAINTAFGPDEAAEVAKVVALLTNSWVT
jgi:hypothetical protein